MAKKNIRGHFVTFEGGEGSGKSTHIKFTSSLLRRKGYKVIVFREPGSTRLSEKIRNILLHFKGRISPQTELFLYLASRTQFIKEKLLKALTKYDFVICDRFSDSTLVYQGYGLGLEINKIEPIVRFASFGIKPDLTIVLDLNPKKALLRIKRKKDRIEKRPLTFHQKLRKGYKLLAEKDPKRIKIINAKDKKLVQKSIVEILKDYA